MRRFSIAIVIVVATAGCSFIQAGSTLDGTWRLDRGTVDGHALPMPATAPITLTLAGTRASGSSGCNSYGGDATVSDGQFRIGDLLFPNHLSGLGIEGN